MDKNLKTLGIIALIYLITLILVALSAHAEEPIISNFQGTKTGTSVIEVIWPDGKVEKLLYKDKDVENGSKGYVKWFCNRCREAERRTKERICREQCG